MTLLSAPDQGQQGGGSRDWDLVGEGTGVPCVYQRASAGSRARDSGCGVPLYLAHVQGLGARVLLHHEELVPHPAALHAARARRAVLRSPVRRGRRRARRPQGSWRRRRHHQQQQQHRGRQRRSYPETPTVGPRPHAWPARGPGPGAWTGGSRASPLGGRTERRRVTWWP